MYYIYYILLYCMCILHIHIIYFIYNIYSLNKQLRFSKCKIRCSRLPTITLRNLQYYILSTSAFLIWHTQMFVNLWKQSKIILKTYHHRIKTQLQHSANEMCDSNTARCCCSSSQCEYFSHLLET